MKNPLTVLTNIFYVLAGFVLLPVAPSVAICAVFLGVVSGMHHWIGSTWTRRMDYAGMYAVLISLILLPFNVILETALAISLITGIVLGLRPSRWIVGIGILIALALLGLHDIGNFLQVSFIMGVALCFNEAGDKLHPESHNIFHSGWHIATAHAIYLTATYLA